MSISLLLNKRISGNVLPGINTSASFFVNIFNMFLLPLNLIHPDWILVEVNPGQTIELNGLVFISLYYPRLSQKVRISYLII